MRAIDSKYEVSEDVALITEQAARTSSQVIDLSRSSTLCCLFTHQDSQYVSPPSAGAAITIGPGIAPELIPPATINRVRKPTPTLDANLTTCGTVSVRCSTVRAASCASRSGVCACSWS